MDDIVTENKNISILYYAFVAVIMIIFVYMGYSSTKNSDYSILDDIIPPIL